MKRFTFLVFGIAAIVSLVAFSVPAPRHADAASAPFVTEIPDGYCDWQWISSAHEAGNLNSFGAVLGNEILRSEPIANGSSRSRRAQSSLFCITATSRRMKTTSSLAKYNLSFPDLPQTFSSRSGTQQSTQQPAAGGLVTSKTAKLPTRLS